MALEVHGAGDAWATATDAGPRGCLARRQQHGPEAHGQVLRGHAVVGVEGGDEAQVVQEKRQRGLWRGCQGRVGIRQAESWPCHTCERLRPPEVGKLKSEVSQLAGG